jgi:hypothetical protein
LLVLGMGVDMAHGAWPVVMRVLRRFDNGRDKADLPVHDAAFGDHRFRESPNCGGVAAQHGNFEAAFVIEVNVHGRELQLMMLVMGIREALR